MRLRILAPAALTLLAFATGGCGDPSSLRLAVDKGAYHVRGEYMGSQRGVKLFVESLRVEPAREGRRGFSSIVVADFALLNERTTDARIRTGAARIDAGTAKEISPVENHVLNLRPGDLAHVTYTFKLPMAPDDFQGAVIKIDVGDESAPGKFSVPVSVVD